MSKYLLSAAAAAFLMMGSTGGALAAVAPICKDTSGEVVICPAGLDDMENSNWHYVINFVSQTEGAIGDPYQNNPNSNAWFTDCGTATTFGATLTNPGGNQNWGTETVVEKEVTGSRNVNASDNAC